MSAELNRVLLIEDNPGDVELVRLRLDQDKSKFEVCCADRLSAGLTALTAEKPSVVLLDLHLPDSRGAETFYAVLNRAPNLPVVVLSGCDDEALALEAVQHGVQDYLVKGTFDGYRLGRTLRCAIQRQALVTALEINTKEQLALKGEFPAQASEGLHAPLNSIHQLIDAVLDGPAELNSSQRTHLTAALNNTKLLRSVIDDMLEAKKVELEQLRLDLIETVADDEVH